MAKVRFGDIVRDVKINVDRDNNPYENYIAGDHMDSEDLTIHRYGSFATDDVGPAFTRIFKPGQILYGSRRTYLKKVAVAEFEGICANTTFVFESKDEAVLDNRLLPFIMLSDAFTRWSIAHSKGSTNPYVLFSDLADYEFELPTIAEQKVLADKLWAAYRLKESYKKLLAASQEMVKSQFIEMFGNLENNEMGYPVVTLGELFEIGSSKRVFEKDWTTSGVPFYRAREIVKLAENGTVDNELFISEEMYEQYSKKYGIPSSGDIMVTGVGTLGICYLVKPNDRFYYKDGNTLCFHNIGKVNSRFIVECFKMPMIKDQISANAHCTTVGTYTINGAKKTKVILPPLNRQNEFVAIAEQADKSEFELRKSIESIDAVIKSLINS